MHFERYERPIFTIKGILVFYISISEKLEVPPRPPKVRMNIRVTIIMKIEKMLKTTKFFHNHEYWTTHCLVYSCTFYETISGLHHIVPD